MRMIGFFLTVCLVLAALRAAALVIALAIIGAIVVSMIVQPKQTFGCLLMVATLGTFGNYPVAGLIIVATLAGIALLRPRSD